MRVNHETFHVIAELLVVVGFGTTSPQLVQMQAEEQQST